MAPERRHLSLMHFKSKRRFLIPIILITLFLSCATESKITGKWQEVGKKATLELFRNGTFRAVDNEGMAVAGKYYLSDQGNIRFEVITAGPSLDIIEGNIQVMEDQLIFRTLDGSEIERYRRMNKKIF